MSWNWLIVVSVVFFFNFYGSFFWMWSKDQSMFKCWQTMSLFSSSMFFFKWQNSLWNIHKFFLAFLFFARANYRGTNIWVRTVTTIPNYQPFLFKCFTKGYEKHSNQFLMFVSERWSIFFTFFFEKKKIKFFYFISNDRVDSVDVLHFMLVTPNFIHLPLQMETFEVSTNILYSLHMLFIVRVYLKCPFFCRVSRSW